MIVLGQGAVRRPFQAGSTGTGLLNDGCSHKGLLLWICQFPICHMRFYAPFWGRKGQAANPQKKKTLESASSRAPLFTQGGQSWNPLGFDKESPAGIRPRVFTRRADAMN